MDVGLKKITFQNCQFQSTLQFVTVWGRGLQFGDSFLFYMKGKVLILLLRLELGRIRISTTSSSVVISNLFFLLNFWFYLFKSIKSLISVNVLNMWWHCYRFYWENTIIDFKPQSLFNHMPCSNLQFEDFILFLWPFKVHNKLVFFSVLNCAL